MPTFKLSAAVTVSAWTEVEADDIDAAKTIAESRHVQLTGCLEDATESWIIDEADGEPQEIHEC